MIASLLLLLGAVVVFSSRQSIYDQFMAWQFSPSPEIAAISERVGFDERGLFLFNASRPQLLPRDSFNSACRSSATEHTAILGCYAAGQIFLFDIDNDTLDGIKEVTAAHEMLHAAYQRLPPGDRREVDAMLERQDLGADKARIDELMKEYDRTEPGQRYNELHSILGSELRSLSPELERYYGNYFKDRQQLVSLSEKYQSVFAQLRQQQDGLVADLTSLADSIEKRTRAYKQSIAALERDIEAFNKEAGSGSMTRETYNQQRARLEQRQARLSDDYDEVKRLVAVYESKRSQLASTNSQSNALNRSINSAIAPVPGGIDG